MCCIKVKATLKRVRKKDQVLTLKGLPACEEGEGGVFEIYGTTSHTPPKGISFISVDITQVLTETSNVMHRCKCYMRMHIILYYAPLTSVLNLVAYLFLFLFIPDPAKHI